MTALLAIIAMAEYLLNEKYKPSGIGFWFAMVVVALMLLSRLEQTAGWFWLQFLFSGATGIIMFFLVSGMFFATGKRSPADLFTAHGRLLWGVLYIGLLYPYVYLVGGMSTFMTASLPPGGDWLLFLFGVLWVGDTAAMGFGRWLGRRKLAPAVSPNKTVEGFIGGILGALAVGVLMYFWKFQSLEWYHVMALAIGCSVFGQLGDLVESMWKRSVGIKDSSAIIPGHGGVLDRFDSLLFAAPFMFFYRILITVQ